MSADRGIDDIAKRTLDSLYIERLDARWFCRNVVVAIHTKLLVPISRDAHSWTVRRSRTLPTMPPPSRSQTVWVGKLIAEYGSALYAFFRRRTRVQHDAQDLAQEVYLRLLRVSDIDAVRNPEAYMFTVADNLLKERAVLARRRGRSIDLTESVEEALAASDRASDRAVEQDVDCALRTKRLNEVFAELSPKCRAAVLLQYRDERSYAEIAAQLGVSTNMVKKYLAYAVAHCRRRMRSWG